MLLEIDICNKIKQELKSQGRSVRWLASKINRDHSSLNKALQYRSIDSDVLARISDVLSINFFQMLADAFVEEKQKKANE